MNSLFYLRQGVVLSLIFVGDGQPFLQNNKKKSEEKKSKGKNILQRKSYLHDVELFQMKIKKK